MAKDDVRRGVTQATFNEKFGGFLSLQIFALAGGIGYFFKSWIAFGLLLFLLIVALQMPKAAVVMIVVFSVGWAVIAFFVAGMFTGLDGQIVVSILCGLTALGANSAGLQWSKDISSVDSQ
ncbi:MAG TPA: hypothetical protein ENI68_12945 [Gammaproteobacteria bacterium]|nr:hypothetical protein [Gammaproteobacteria bacterium]